MGALRLILPFLKFSDKHIEAPIAFICFSDGQMLHIMHLSSFQTREDALVRIYNNLNFSEGRIAAHFASINFSEMRIAAHFAFINFSDWRIVISQKTASLSQCYGYGGGMLRNFILP